MLKPRMLLLRTQAIELSGLTRKRIEKLANEGKVRTLRTKGNHRRYNRDDILNLNIKDEKPQQ